MINTPKHPQRKAYEDTVVIERLNDGKLRLQFSVDISKTSGWYKPTTPQKKIRPGLSDTPENYTLLESKCLQIHLDFLNGCFDPTLVKYGIGKERPQLAIVPPAKKEMGLLELYDKYVEYREKDTALNTLRFLRKTFRNAIEQAINTVGEDALAIRNWLVSNKSNWTAKETIRNLGKAYKLGIKHGFSSLNPFEDMAEELSKSSAKNRLDDDHEADDEEIFSQELSYSIEEMEAIINYVYDKKPKYAQLIEFLFLSGCRISEAIAIKWSDIKWERECIVISRQWSSVGKCFVPLKGTSHLPEHKQYRIFPMPKEDRLWKLMKAITKKENKYDVVFPSERGMPLFRETIHQHWRGGTGTSRIKCAVIPELIKQGKVSKYLSIHHTRHTFSCIQQNVYGIDQRVVASWCGHHPEVNDKHYWEANRRIKPGYGEVPANQQAQQQSEIDLLKQQNKLQQEQMEEMKKMIEELTRGK
ncbi:tyrosine-type recombinase/integrase [Nostoc sp.]|uniref:tyrosine-type recombinase/integrase n=1 Tax=Nostoc sp. TaxID=1180 RepID=UPI002FF940BD